MARRSKEEQEQFEQRNSEGGLWLAGDEVVHDGEQPYYGDESKVGEKIDIPVETEDARPPAAQRQVKARGVKSGKGH